MVRASTGAELPPLQYLVEAPDVGVDRVFPTCQHPGYDRGRGQHPVHDRCHNSQELRESGDNDSVEASDDKEQKKPCEHL